MGRSWTFVSAGAGRRVDNRRFRPYPSTVYLGVPNPAVERLVRELTAGANAVVVFVDFYPVAVEESYAVLKYVAEHPDEFGADARRIAIAGDSVGSPIQKPVD